MKITLKYSLVSCLFIILLNGNLFSQDEKKFAKIKVVGIKGDTIFGFIKVKGFFVGTPNAKLTVYNNEKKTNTYYPADIKSFSFDQRYFEAVYLATPACISCRKDVFLERIEQGKIDLFFYYDCKATLNYTLSGSALKCINYYYIRKNENDTLFLAFRERQSLSIVTQPNNFVDFCSYFKDNSIIYEGLLNKKYQRENINELVRSYNTGMNIDTLIKQEGIPLIDRIVLPSDYDINNIEDYYVKLNEELKRVDIFCNIEHVKKMFSNGKINYQGYNVMNCGFVEKIPVGIWLYYNKNGTLKSIDEYDQFGQKNGECKIFNENGELISTVHYKKGKKI
jgi:antitoxin component YwqK of YwqJK toxin-antitoxin module